MIKLIEVGNDTPTEAVRRCYIAGHLFEVCARIEDADDSRGRHIVLAIEDMGPLDLAARHEAMAARHEAMVQEQGRQLTGDSLVVPTKQRRVWIWRFLLHGEYRYETGSWGSGRWEHEAGWRTEAEAQARVAWLNDPERLAAEEVR